MTDIKAVVRAEHPDIVLTGTVAHDRTSNVSSVSEAGTDPTSGKFFYRIESADFDRFEQGLRKDRTVGAFERVIDTRDEEAIYSFEYTDEAKLLSPVVSAANGVILDMKNDGRAWILTIWAPDRTDLVHLWEYAQQNNIDIDLLRVNEYDSLGNTDAGLTDSQREALLVAFEMVVAAVAAHLGERFHVLLGEGPLCDLDVSRLDIHTRRSRTVVKKLWRGSVLVAGHLAERLAESLLELAHQERLDGL